MKFRLKASKREREERSLVEAPWLPEAVMLYYDDGMQGIKKAISSLSEAHQAQLQEMSRLAGHERVMRSSAMTAFLAEVIAHQIRSANPGLTERQLKILLAKRMYMGDRTALKLLQGVR